MLVILVRCIILVSTIHRRRRQLVQNNEKRKRVDFEGCAWPLNMNKNTSVLVVLGSGGHTAEMLTLVSDMMGYLPNGTKLTYVTGVTDSHSASKANDLHRHEATGGGASTSSARIPRVAFVTLPRAREVKQPWISSIASSAKTVIAAIRLVWQTKPDVVLTNGPGTSAVVAAVTFFRRVLMPSATGRCNVIYVESFARVETLSLSGKLVYGFADRFVVQWEQLYHKWPLAEFYGRLC